MEIVSDAPLLKAHYGCVAPTKKSWRSVRPTVGFFMDSSWQRRICDHLWNGHSLHICLRADVAGFIAGVGFDGQVEQPRQLGVELTAPPISRMQEVQTRWSMADNTRWYRCSSLPSLGFRCKATSSRLTDAAAWKAFEVVVSNNMLLGYEEIFNSPHAAAWMALLIFIVFGRCYVPRPLPKTLHVLDHFKYFHHITKRFGDIERIPRFEASISPELLEAEKCAWEVQILIYMSSDINTILEVTVGFFERVLCNRPIV
ncbi:hypothetical protein BCR43DRAFT_565230 [Syncephalastrum racemosum]|uniref:Uncharacterized protein n=1 Tax=Syncephalastrum racemosum TaxID=13706 RepID=A0A1X2H8Z7_SYNRA|nr:hypothetical protein BCR43DRAFT_565230 [Syncephalastrum racemosum]